MNQSITENAKLANSTYANDFSNRHHFFIAIVLPKPRPNQKLVTKRSPRLTLVTRNPHFQKAGTTCNNEKSVTARRYVHIYISTYTSWARAPSQTKHASSLGCKKKPRGPHLSAPNRPEISQSKHKKRANRISPLKRSALACFPVIIIIIVSYSIRRRSFSRSLSLSRKAPSSSMT